jgi:hypothetical protein
MLPHAGAVGWRLLVAVLSLELVYLLVANTVLKTDLLKDFAASGDDLRLDYASAHSILPGRVEVDDLRVRFHDRNVEFLISVERGTLDVSLHELFVRRFHALRVDGKKVSYRMRHKVSRVGKEGPRLAAYPPIPGFRDPPLYEKGEDQPAPPIPEEEYDLWDVQVDAVNAEVVEVWILEYRYLGPGLATGAFRVKPARYYDVRGTTLDLRGGRLTLGQAVVAEKAHLAIQCSVTGSDPRRLQGLEPLRHVSAGVRGRLEGMDLAFLDAYLAPRLGAAASGPGRVDLELRVERGVISPGSLIEVTSAAARLDVAGLRVAGPAAIGLARPSPVTDASSPFQVYFRSPRLLLDIPKGESARVEDMDLGVSLTPDLTRSVRVVRASLAPMRVHLPDVASFGRALPFASTLPRLGGRAALALQASKEADRPIQAAFRLALSDATLAVGGSRTLPWNATLESDDVVAELSGRPNVQGTLKLHVERTSPLLPLVSSSSLARQLGERVLELGALDATAKLKVAERARLELVEARSGIVRARGWVVERQDGAHGRMLLATQAANVGVSISPAGTETELLVGDDWLASESRARGGPRRSERGGLPRTRGETRNKSAKDRAARQLH